MNGALTNVIEELQIARAELQAAKDQHELSTQEVLALRSEIRALKQRQNNNNNTTRASSAANTTTVRDVSGSSGDTNQQGIIDFNLEAGGDRNNSNVVVNNGAPAGIPSVVRDHASPIAKNPYPLPPLVPKILKLIEDGEYIDFDKLKPKKPGNPDDGMDGYALRVTQDDNGDGDTVRLKKTCNNRIEKFPEWLEVWNTFMFARLHYKPQEHAALLTYQKAITQFAKSHRFPAVFAYDIDFRKKIAAEQQLPPEHRTTFWAIQHLELKNQHLHNQWIAPVVCYSCKENGHSSRVFPNSKKFSKGSNFATNPFPGSPHPVAALSWYQPWQIHPSK